MFVLTVERPNLESQAAERAFIQNVVQHALTEFGRGTATEGEILGRHPTTGASHAVLGHWTYKLQAAQEQAAQE